jgi:hypothetical protein
MHNNVDVRIGSKDKNRPNVRMCLKVCTLSDIATGNGITLQQDTIEGKAGQSISSKAYGWPQNPKPTSCIRTWQRALRLTFMTGQCLTIRPELHMGDWTSTSCSYHNWWYTSEVIAMGTIGR